MEIQTGILSTRSGAGAGARVPGAAAAPTHLRPAEAQAAPCRVRRERREGKPAAPQPSSGSPSSHRVPRATPSRRGTRGSPGERARLLTGLHTQPAALCGAVTRNPPPPPDAPAEPRVPTSERWPGGECCTGLHRTAGSAPPAAAAQPPPLPPLSRRDPEWEEPTGQESGRVPALAPPRLFPPPRKLGRCEGRDRCVLGGALAMGRSLGLRVGPEGPGGVTESWEGPERPGRGLDAGRSLRVLGRVLTPRPGPIGLEPG